MAGDSRKPVPPLKSYGVADFFCGAGGLSVGFELTGRFAARFGCDIRPEAVETFVANHGRGNAPTGWTGDIAKLEASQVAEAFSADQPLSCLVGGPPCEGFSQNRSENSGGAVKRGTASRVSKFVDDPRNHLFRHFVNIAEKLKPPVVLIENVPDLLRHRDGETANDILESLREAGYVAKARVLNAANFGVPQTRRRAFILGQLEKDYLETGISLEFPLATHTVPPFVHADWAETTMGDAGYWPSVWEAIGDLPNPRAKHEASLPILGEYSGPTTRLRQWLRRPGSEIYNHVARPLGVKSLAKVRALESAGTRANPRRESDGVRKYHYSYARLKWNEPARTITKFVYHSGSGMFTHPSLDRAVTVREAGRLQTFPDDFRFIASSIRDMSSLVGSAVPPLLASCIARQVVRYLDALGRARLDTDGLNEWPPQPTDRVLQALESREWDSHSERSAIPSSRRTDSSGNVRQLELAGVTK